MFNWRYAVFKLTANVLQVYLVADLESQNFKFRKEKGHVCTGFAKDGHLILQADHLLSRSNSATFADTRLIVCVCKGIHGWKSTNSELRKKEYDERVKKLISKDRVKLWEKCEKDMHSHKTCKMDWSMEILNLKNELNKYANNTTAKTTV